MAESVIQKGSGGAASDECTAGKAQVLAGYTAVTKDSGDEPVAGTMANCGAVSQALNCGGSYTVPEGYHNGGGKITAKSLASQTGGATAEDKYVLNGKTYWKDGVKRTGSMTVASVASFSVAPYSTSQVLATWKNPGRGPYSGVLICAKAGGYPNNAWDGITYQGVGNNSAVNGTSSQIIGGLAAGTTYYFRIWVYCTCSAGDQYSGYLQTTCAPTAHGRAAFTASGTWTVPAGVRSINVHCTGGGGGGENASYSGRSGGSGGGGGYTAYKNDISVAPENSLAITVGAGGKPASSSGSIVNSIGGSSEVMLNNNSILVINGGNMRKADNRIIIADGGSGGGGGGARSTDRVLSGEGGSDGGSGGGYDGGRGQGATTKEFGTGTLYAGGGGGGLGHIDYTTNGGRSPQLGGAGGGGNGGYAYGVDSQAGKNGTAGSGGGGGGGAYTSGTGAVGGGNGGSGNVIITW